MFLKNKAQSFFKNNYCSFLIIIFFIGFIFFLHWNSFTSPWEGDEGEYAYSAWLMQQDITPYQNSFIQKPPLIIYTYYLSHLIKPYSIWFPRFLGFLTTIGVCFLLALTAKKLYGNRAGWLALWISPLLLSVASFDALPANTEKFMLLPLTGLLALFVYKKNKETFLVYLAAGSLGALAILYKPIAILPVIILIIYWLISNWLKNKNTKTFLKSLGLITFGGVLTTFIILAYFIWHGAFKELWQETFIFNLSYAANTKNYFPEMFFRYITLYFKIFWPIIIIVFASFIIKNRYIFLWWSLLAVSLLTIITSAIPHYYLLLAPFVVLLCAGSFSSLLEKIKIKQQGSESKNIILIAVLAIIVIIFSLNLGEQFFLKPREFAKWLWNSDNTWGEMVFMGDKIKQYTKKDDRIFVGGSEPQLYYFSQRRSASQFDTTFPLSINTPWCEYYQTQAIKELNNNKPTAIILPIGDVSLWEPGAPTIFIDYLRKELKENYKLVGGAVSKYEVSTYIGPEWLEPDKISFDNKNSLLLFIRK